MFKTKTLFACVCTVFFLCSSHVIAAGPEKTILYIAEEKVSFKLRNQFTETHPNVEFVDVAYDRSIRNPSEMIDGFDELDIVCVTNRSNLLKLIRDDLIEPLTSPGIIRNYQTYFPQVKESLEYNGRIMGVPIRLKIQPWYVNQQIWDELRLPNVPTTFDEYIDLVNIWYQDYSSSYPEYAMAGDPGWGGTRSTIIMNLLEQYIYEQQQPGALLSFDNNSLKALLERISAIEELSYLKTFDGPLIQGYFDADFRTVDLVDLQSIKTQELIPILPPSIVEGSKPKVGGELSALCVLRQSNNKELAIDYLNFVSEHPDLYQVGLSQMLHTQEYGEGDDSVFSTDAIDMWNLFVPNVVFYADILDIRNISVIDLCRSWDHENDESSGIEEFLENLNRNTARFVNYEY